MSFRKLAKEAFVLAKDKYKERHNDQAHHEQQQQQQYPQQSSTFPGQQYHGGQHYGGYQQQQQQQQQPMYPPVGPPSNYNSGYSHPEYYPSTGQRPVNPLNYPQQPQQPQSWTRPAPAPAPTSQEHNIKPVGDIFTPLPTAGVIPIEHTDDHPVGRQVVKSPTPCRALQTNAFYGNLLVSGQSFSVWTNPYSLCWAKGQGNARSWGMAVSHIDREQFAFGGQTVTGASQYYINPLGIHSIILSAAELQDSTSLTLDSLQALSANASLAPNASSAPILTIPLLQGMGFVTGLYKNCSPLVESSVFIRNLEQAGVLNNGATTKYRVTLEDSRTWLMYITPVTPQSGLVPATMTRNTAITLPNGFTGTVQVAKLPHGASEEFYDKAAGAYPITCILSATASGDQGIYTLAWEKRGLQNPLIMYALPHHSGAFTRKTAPHVVPMSLQTATKGMAAAVIADSWEMHHQLPVNMGFMPWAPDRKLSASLPREAIDAIIAAGRAESDQDVVGGCHRDSMYFSGKALAKFAMMAIALHDIAHEQALTNKVLQKLKQAFALFVENRQITPLVYEKGWRGVVSRSGMTNPGADFGNGYYNDHHFHYGYFVYAGAVLAHLDPSWLHSDGGKSSAWVNMLVQDFANPVNDDHFPFFRAFDWFNGHSWAKGLFEQGDGKDEESTSEDAFASYALKMWGHVTGDANAEARGNLMLAIQAKVFQAYFLMEETPGRSVQPEQILKNKVTGITFDNKVDHATWFGGNIEWIQGIHMIPLAPPSTLIRTPAFVREEWETYFSNGRVDQVGGGWRGILYANLAIVDPKRAYAFFSHPNFDWGWLDDGASRTWYLAFCAMLGGS